MSYARVIGSAGLRRLSGLLAWPLERRDRPQPADAIVVVGAPLTAAGQLSSVGEERVAAAVELWHLGLAPLLCLSGGGPARDAPLGQRREADAMAERAIALGVPAHAIRVERDSRSTADNARFTARALAADQCRRVWVVTQPFHTRRCRYWFRRFGFETLVWSAPDSLQYRHPRRGLEWIGREYGAWLRMWAIEWHRRRQGDESPRV